MAVKAISGALALLATVGSAMALLLTVDHHMPLPNGGRNHVHPVTNFTISPYLGVWYEIARTPNIFELGLKCVTATYSLDSENRVSLTNRGIRMFPFPKRVSQVHGMAVAPNTNEPAKLKVKFDYIPGMANYWILDTDYKSWAVVYSPSNTIPRPPSVFVLAREPFPNGETVQKALNVLAVKTGILVKDLTITKQEAGNC